MKIILCVLFAFISISLSSQGSGNLLSYNGITQYVDIGSQVADNCRTLEFWFKPNSTITSAIPDATALIIRDYLNGSGLNTNEFGFYFTPGSWNPPLGGTLTWYRRVGNTFYTTNSNATSWQAGIWYHVAGVIDPVSGMKLYINGVLQTDTDPSTQPIQIQTGAATDMIAIATWGYWGANSGNRFFDGDIDEVRFWTTARSQTQVRDNMCMIINPVQPGLQGYYRFDGNSTTVLADLTGNNYNGSLVALAANSWHYSSAPLGDTSSYVYPSSWAAQTLTLQYSAGDAFSLSNVTGPSEGAHIYRVNSLPNMTTGLMSPLSNYYAVFLTGTSGNYNIFHDFAGFGSFCAATCQSYATRNDNASPVWTTIAPAFNNCTLTKTNESTNGVSYREEYILTLLNNIPANILGNDTALCSSQVFPLNANVPGATFLWNTNATSSSISVSSPGIYWVDVTVNGCTQRDSIIISINTLPQISLGSDTAVCAGDILIYSMSDPATNYTWSDGGTDLTMVVSSPGIYWVTAQSGSCMSHDTIVVSYLAEVNLGPDILLCELTNGILLDAGASGTQYSWSTNDTTQTLQVNQPGIYWVNVSTAMCNISDTIKVLGELGGNAVFIPNSFTPNGDGKNDVFNIVSSSLTSLHMEIYNRWGQLVFMTDDINEGWNGKYKGEIVAGDVFVVRIIYSTSCANGREFGKLAHVNVIR